MDTDSMSSVLGPRSSVEISRSDRQLISRLAIISLFLLCFTAAFSSLFRNFTRRFDAYTGPAQWIWASHQISRNVPVVFFATREFDMPRGWKFAQLRLYAEPESTLWFNGHEIASRRDFGTGTLHVYDLTQLARPEKNRIVVAVRSTNGVGGLLASLGVDGENENAIVTDRSWKILRTWNDALPLRDVGRVERPMVLGEPPLGRWHYLSPAPAEPDVAPTKVLEPKQAIEFVATIPNVKIVEGVAVATKESVRATAFDFGFTRGRVRLSLVGDQPVPPVVMYRLANVKDEFGVVEAAILSTPFGAGEQVLTEPDVRSFRYVIVFGGRARAEVVQ